MRRRFAILGSSLLACALSGAAGAADSPKSPERRPVPEYAPVAAVLASEDLFAFDYHAAELADAVTAAGAELWIATNAKNDGAALKRQLKKDGLPAAALEKVQTVTLAHDSIWLRDYGPVPYMEMNASGPTLGLGALKYDDGTKASDKLPAAFGARTKLPVTPVQAYVDGGNLLVAGDVCITSGPVGGTPRTALDPARPGLTAASGATLGCRAVIVLDAPPHAHVDMWAKAVSDREILVSAITEKTLSVARSSGSLPEAQLLKDALDRMARELSKTFTVTRIPMPLPYRGVFRTYTNAILVNGTAVIPRYTRFGWNYDEYPDKALASYYEGEAAKAYKAAGFKPRFINADGMIFNGGAFHCVTVALPKPNGTSPLKGH